MKKLLIALALAGGMLCANATQKFAYKGKLERADGAAFEATRPMTMAFRLYNQATGGRILWGRTMPVRVEADGSFYVELADDRGSVSDQDLPYAEIADALASGGETFYFGLTPDDYSELAPRQMLASVPRALCAVSADKIVDLKADTLSASVVKAANATVANAVVRETFQTPAQGISLNVANNATITAQNTIKITDGIDGFSAYDSGNILQEGFPTIYTLSDTFMVVMGGIGVQNSSWTSLLFPASESSTANSGMTSALWVYTFSFGKRD